MIEVAHESDPDPITMEKCCFCRTPTRYWFEAKDVAVCRRCARYAEASDVPTKKAWCRREEIARKGQGGL